MNFYTIYTSLVKLIANISDDVKCKNFLAFKGVKGVLNSKAVWCFTRTTFDVCLSAVWGRGWPQPQRLPLRQQQQAMENYQVERITSLGKYYTTPFPFNFYWLVFNKPSKSCTCTIVHAMWKTSHILLKGCSLKDTNTEQWCVAYLIFCSILIEVICALEWYIFEASAYDWISLGMYTQTSLRFRSVLRSERWKGRSPGWTIRTFSTTPYSSIQGGTSANFLT